MCRLAELIKIHWTCWLSGKGGLTQAVGLVRVGGDMSGGPSLRRRALVRVAPRPIPTAAGQRPSIRILDVPSAVTASAAAFPQPV